MIDQGFPGGPSQYLRNENTRLKNENAKLKKENADLMTQTGVKAYQARADAKVEQAKKNNIRILGFWESTKEELASSESAFHPKKGTEADSTWAEIVSSRVGVVAKRM